jgi:hypothetical protein
LACHAVDDCQPGRVPDPRQRDDRLGYKIGIMVLLGDLDQAGDRSAGLALAENLGCQQLPVG